MSKGESAEDRAAREKFKSWLQEAEAAAAELVEVGDLLFRGGQRSDPALLRRYRLYGGATTRARACRGAAALQKSIESIDAVWAAAIRVSYSWCCSAKAPMEKIVEDLWNRSLQTIVLAQEKCLLLQAKLMPAPTARQLEQRAEEARAIAEQMRDPRTKRTMVNLALSYERLAKHAAMSEASEAEHPLPEDDQNRAA